MSETLFDIIAEFGNSLLQPGYRDEEMSETLFDIIYGSGSSPAAEMASLSGWARANKGVAGARRVLLIDSAYTSNIVLPAQRRSFCKVAVYMAAWSAPGLCLEQSCRVYGAPQGFAPKRGLFDRKIAVRERHQERSASTGAERNH